MFKIYNDTDDYNFDLYTFIIPSKNNCWLNEEPSNYQSIYWVRKTFLVKEYTINNSIDIIFILSLKQSSSPQNVVSNYLT